MSKILALDTATEACSVALYCDGEIRENFQVLPRLHSQRILPMIEQLLADAGLTLKALDALAFGRGPGAFTGLRIATGMMQGLAFGADLPVCAISSLAALAQQGQRLQGASKVLAAIDARMDEVYWGEFALVDGLMQPTGAEAVCAPEQVPLSDAEWGIGSGWQLVDRFGFAPARLDPEGLPMAQDIARLAVAELAAGRAVAAEQAQPVYLRDKVAKKKHEQVKARA